MNYPLKELSVKETENTYSFRPSLLSLFLNAQSFEEELMNQRAESSSIFNKENYEQVEKFRNEEKAFAFERPLLESITKPQETSKDNTVTQIANELRTIIKQDEFIDGEISQSESYIQELYANSGNEFGQIVDALMQLYVASLLDSHILEGILIMISNVPYSAVEPKGQVMAMGLLTNKELLIRDRAIQCFEKWNSKKGLEILESLDCHPSWLQRYVEKVILYIERNGID